MPKQRMMNQIMRKQRMMNQGMRKQRMMKVVGGLGGGATPLPPNTK
jgi:hypothetical protein